MGLVVELQPQRMVGRHRPVAHAGHPLTRGQRRDPGRSGPPRAGRSSCARWPSPGSSTIRAAGQQAVHPPASAGRIARPGRRPPATSGVRRPRQVAGERLAGPSSPSSPNAAATWPGRRPSRRYISMPDRIEAWSPCRGAAARPPAVDPGVPGEQPRQQGSRRRAWRCGENIWPGRPRNGSSAPFRLTSSLGRDPAVQAHPDQDRSAGRVADGHVRAHVERRQQRRPAPRAMPGSDRPVGRRHRGEAVAGQVGRDHGEALGQQRREVAPGMGGGAGAVDQQERPGRCPSLHVPAQAGRAGRSGWPRGSASPARPVPDRAVGRRLAARRARARAVGPRSGLAHARPRRRRRRARGRTAIAASACGSGR